MFIQPINQLWHLWEDILIYTANRPIGWVNYIYDRLMQTWLIQACPWDGRQEKE